MKPKIKLFLIVLAGLVVLAGLGVAIAKAADASRPGDLLFAADKALENLERTLIPGRKNNLSFEEEILEERVGELSEIEEEAMEMKDEKDLERIQRAIDRAEEEVSDQEDKISEVDIYLLHKK